jgi:Ser/Thr protein kinase RdoA (MazF antagonist)
VQRALPGERPTDPAAIAGAAGELARRLHGAAPGALPASPPADQLVAVRGSATLAAALVPEVAARVERLLDTLCERLPEPGGLVSAHGDFHAGALLARGETLYVLGFDGARRAAPAVDLASYAAGAASGDNGDGEARAAVLEGLLEGYGHRPDALEWHLSAALLARAADPFRHLSADWPARVDGMVRTAEEVLSR